MSFLLEVDGKPFDTYLTFSVTRSIETFAGQFSFTCTDADKSIFPIKQGSVCRASVNGEYILTGHVEKISPSVSSGSHEVSIQGRDITADLVDSTLAADSVELTTPVSLVDVIKATQAACGLNLKVINQVNIEPYQKEDLVSCKAGQGAFELLETYARKRQVLLTTDGHGNIVITRNSGITLDFAILNERGSEYNNVLSSQSETDYSKRFHEYVVVSQANLTAMNNFGAPDLSRSVNQKNLIRVIDPDIRQGRILRLVAENASSDDQCLQRAKWEMNVRKARSISYSCDLQGLVVDGLASVLVPNRLVRVSDDDSGISSTMLIKSVTISTGMNGSITSLELADRNAYSLEISEPKKDKRANPVFTQFDPSRILGNG